MSCFRIHCIGQSAQYFYINNYNTTNNAPDGQRLYRAPHPTLTELPYVTPQEFSNRGIEMLSEGNNEQEPGMSIEHFNTELDKFGTKLKNEIKEVLLPEHADDLFGSFSDLINIKISDIKSEITAKLLEMMDNYKKEHKSQIDSLMDNYNKEHKLQIDSLKSGIDQTHKLHKSTASSDQSAADRMKYMRAELFAMIKTEFDKIKTDASYEIAPLAKLRSELHLFISEMERRLKSMEDRVKTNTILIDERTSALTKLIQPK